MNETNKLTAGLLDRVPGVTRGWRVSINSEPAETPRSLTIELERTPGDPKTRLGRLEYGAEPKSDGTASGYDTFVFHERGGAVTLPFAFVDGGLFVAVVEQRRFAETHPEYNPSGRVQNAPRGFHNVGATAVETVQTELNEEIGVFKGVTFRLPGEPINANNAWFSYEDEENSDGQSVGQGGAIPHAVEVNATVLEADGTGGYRIRSECLGERPKGSPYEMIGNCTFLPWLRTVALRDGFTSQAVARLLSHLVATKRLELSFSDKS